MHDSELIAAYRRAQNEEAVAEQSGSFGFPAKDRMKGLRVEMLRRGMSDPWTSGSCSGSIGRDRWWIR